MKLYMSIMKKRVVSFGYGVFGFCNLLRRTRNNFSRGNDGGFKKTAPLTTYHLLLIPLILLATSLYAQPNGFKPVSDEKAVKAKLDAVSKTITSIKSDFVQEKKLAVMNKKIISKGKFLFKKENKLRLEYTEPFEYMMAVNKDKIYIKDEGKVSTYDGRSNKLFKQINVMILASIQGTGNSKDFRSSYFETEKQYLLILKPLTKSVSGMIQTLEIYLDKKDCSVNKFEMIEPSGEFTSIQLLTKEINVPISDENFVLK